MKYKMVMKEFKDRQIVEIPDNADSITIVRYKGFINIFYLVPEE